MADPTTSPGLSDALTLPAPAERVDPGSDTLEALSGAARYESRGLLGKGGMGEVSLCRDRVIGREIALKSIAPGESGSASDARGRFLREARVQGQLEHPAIVPVYDLGKREDGAPFFTMKRVRGETLDEVVASARGAPEREHWSRRRLLSAFSSACLAVDFAHSRGVLHRDLKPANVMLGDFGEVYVLDWGLAKLTGEAADAAAARPIDLAAGGTDSDVRTVAGAILGTPGYMSPEQILGDPIDARSDVYALGTILFELLTLQPLHAERGAAAIFESTLRGPEARPSVRCPERDVPPELERIVVRATDTKPERRFQSARELSEAIEAYLDGDRDVELRRALAKRHAELAGEAVVRALAEGSDAERKAALREISRALALDPENTEAMRALIDLVMTPQRELPEEVKLELEGVQREQVRVGGRTGTLAYLSFLLYLPLLFWMGIRSPHWVVLLVGLALAAAATSLVVSRMPKAKSSIGVLWVSTLAIASLAGVFGPFVLVPSVAAANVLAFYVTNPRSERRKIVAIGSLSVLLPLVLEWLGVLPPAYRFTPEGLLIVPRAAWMPELATTVFLAVSSLAILATASLAIAPFRDEFDEAQRRIRLLSWHLRHLLPERALGDVRRAA
jgi:serine/threonine-protein kinase